MRVQPIVALSTVLIVSTLATSCGDDSSGSGDEECTPQTECGDEQIMQPTECPECTAFDDGCGGTYYCKPDPTCETPCPEGAFEELGACDDPSCSERMACGTLVTCRDQASCLAEAVCPDGGPPLDSCGSVQGCIPYYLCGADMGCVTLTQCARDACDPGEVANTMTCDHFDLPCRSVSECGETFSCVCGADTLECDEGLVRSSSPCSGGEICTPVTGCGVTFYCHGDSI